MANWTQSYAYDRYGNRTNVTASGITANSQNVPTDGLPTQSYDQPSNRISTPGYEYDLAGNLTRGQAADGSWQRSDYDAAGRVYRVWNDDRTFMQENNEYGVSRQRELAWHSNNNSVITWYVWGGQSVIAEYDGSFDQNIPLTWKKSYIYAGSRLLSTFTNNGVGSETLEFQHPDRLGTKLVTNNQANTSFEQSTLPFGTALDAETSGTTNQRFTSYDRSTVAQLDYAVNRSYSSGTGRFTSVDPIGMSAASLGNPQSLNLYAYVENNPIDFVDPTGLFMANPDIGTFTVNVTAEVGGGVEAGLMALLWSIMFQPLMDLPVAPVDSGSGGGGGGEQPNKPSDLAPNGLASKRKLSEAECDNYLARIFGGNGAVVGSTADPLTLDKFNPPNFNGYRNESGNLPNGFNNRALGHGPEPYDKGGSTDKGGIIHIYADGDGNSKGPLYAPAGGAMGAIFKTGKGDQTNENRVVSYATGLKITFVHVAGTTMNDKNGLGSVRIGDIGGLGASPKQSPGYTHTHIVFAAGGKRVDPRKVFCGW